MAYVDTDTCSYCHGSTNSDADSNLSNTDTGSDSHGSTDSYSDRDPANGDTSASCDGRAHGNTNTCAYIESYT